MRRQKQIPGIRHYHWKLMRKIVHMPNRKTRSPPKICIYVISTARDMLYNKLNFVQYIL